MIPRRALAFCMGLCLTGLVGPAAPAAPKLLSVHPLGGQRGTDCEVEVRGSSLEGASAVWLGAGCLAKGKFTQSPAGIEAFVKAVPDGARVRLQVKIAPTARVGFHTLAVVSPAGVSGPVAFWVGDHAVLPDNETPHRTPATARPVKVPVAVHGRISENGQLNYYAFDAVRGQNLAFEVIALNGAAFDPQLRFLRPGAASSTRSVRGGCCSARRLPRGECRPTGG